MTTSIDARLTISRTHCGGDEDYITITVEDTLSGIDVCSIKMSLADFTLAITGRSFLPVPCAIPDAEDRHHLGMRRIVKRISCPKPPTFKKDERDAHVLQHFASTGLAEGGWEVSSTGTRTRQDGLEHNYIIHRWETTND